MADRQLIVRIAGDSRSIERAFKRSGKAADTFGKKIKRLSTGRGLGRVGRIAGVGAISGGAGLLGLGAIAGVSSVKAAAGFEKTMARITGLAGQSQKQVAQWSNQLLALGPALGKTPQELAEALYFIASAGIPASKAIDTLTASAKASAAGLGETQVVADAVTSVMNAYASSGMDATHATNVLIATVREGKGEADAFAGVIGNVSAYASRLKVPFEDVGAALAAMTQLGTDPATAATQLSAFFSSVLKVTPKAEKAAKKVGFSFSSLGDILQKKGLLAALNYVKEGFKGNTQAMAEAFPNIRALRALLALTANDGGKTAGVFNRMKDSTGALGTAWGAAQETSSHNMDKLHASLETLKIAFGQGLAPVVGELADYLSKKLADPAFIARVRELGKLIGVKLRDAFKSVGAWVEANWPQIKQGFYTALHVVRTFWNVLRQISNLTPGGPTTLIGLIVSGVLLSKIVKIIKAFSMIPGLPGGGKGAKGGAKGAGKAFSLGKKLLPFATPLLANPITAGAAAIGASYLYNKSQRDKAKDAFNALTPVKQRQLLQQTRMPMEYLKTIGWNLKPLRHKAPPMRRGPGTPGWVPETAFTGGGADMLHVHVHLNKREIGHAVVGSLQKAGKTNAASRRGRFGGQNLALG